MKNQIPIVVTFLTSALIALGFFAVSRQEIPLISSVIVFCFALMVLFTGFLSRFDSERIKTVVAYTSSFSLVSGLIIQLGLVLYGVSVIWEIVPIGLFSMIYLSIVYFVSNSKQ